MKEWIKEHIELFDYEKYHAHRIGLSGQRKQTIGDL